MRKLKDSMGHLAIMIRKSQRYYPRTGNVKVTSLWFGGSTKYCIWISRKLLMNLICK